MIKKIRVLLKFLMFAMPLYAKYATIDSRRELQRKLPDYRYVVICVHNTRPDGDRLSREQRKDINETRQALKSIAGSPDYRKILRNDIAFFWIDLGDKDNHDIIRMLDISKDKPVCLILDEGKQIASMPLSDETTQLDLLKFINQHLGEKVNRLIEEHEHEQELERQERIEQYRALASRPYYWGYSPAWGYRPWGYYGGWYGRPGFGFGFMV